MTQEDKGYAIDMLLCSVFSVYFFMLGKRACVSKYFRDAPILFFRCDLSLIP